ncbi:hypothetical protein E3O53_12570 [Cryobacterium sp. TMT2-18-3]|uniref:hypothetical protein n=1 Tax=unclassified Cryobacterium TaxID=2649013 RepID=UPI00106A0988|nr:MULTISPECIES: hypothetical protein [unclassified Cryobacterium]TFC28311.1 hypothetical protein E3O22_08635 [Cryobacterium sp. TMT2-18-2]TFC62382.1 hypothetical protein E3O53_12570 [Cryobacterium sp. TMT2-18-3]
MTDRDDNFRRATAMVTATIDDRLNAINEPRGFRTAVTEGVFARLDSITSRLRVQFDHLQTRGSERIPDAYFVDEMETENELQKVSAGLRSALALGGILGNPLEIEDSLAANLTPTGGWARRSEASRVPRPKARPTVFEWSQLPFTWAEDKGLEWPPAGATALAKVRQFVGEDAERVRVGEAPYSQWVQLGFIERQLSSGRRHPKSPRRQILLMSGLEGCGEAPPLNSAPLSELPPDLWVRPYRELMPGFDQQRARAAVATAAKPLAALVSFEGSSGAPATDRGLGLHEFCLTPQLEIVALLGLRPETPAIRLVLIDDKGPGIVCRQWRRTPTPDGRHGPVEPTTQGADLIIRPDLFEVLEGAIGLDRLALGVGVIHHQGQLSTESDNEE